MKVALAQIAPKLGDSDANLERHLEIIRRCGRKGADLIVFPELSLTGYMLQDLVAEVAEPVRGSRRLKAIASTAGSRGVILGLVERGEGHLQYNTAVCLARGRRIGSHRKVHLPTYGMFDEGRYFAAGESFRAFDAPWGRTGLLVCEDFWHLSASYLLALQGMDLLAVISASPAKGLDASKELRSVAVWTELAQVVARQLTCWVLLANRVGYEDGRAFQGGSFICAPTGDLVVRAKPLKEEIVVADLPERVLRRARANAPLLREEKPDLVRREIDRILGERAGAGSGRRRGSREEK
jgi:predicted amidohydrolase